MTGARAPSLPLSCGSELGATLRRRLAENTTDYDACDSLGSWDYLNETFHVCDVTSNRNVSWC